MLTAYAHLAFLIFAFSGGALGQLTRRDIASDGLCTYTFRDVCVSQRMRDVVELRDDVKSLQAQLILLNKVVAAIPDLREAMKQLEGKIDDVKEKAQEETGTGTHKSTCGGAVYIRWGRKTCSGNGTKLLYWGVAAGSHYTHNGGGSNYLCMPRYPEWGPKATAGFQSGGHLYGAEYEVPSSNDPFSKANAQSLHDNDVPCAVCHVTNRPTKLMIPAKLTCPDGWIKEYSGYLMAEHYTHKRTTYVCMDNAPEVIEGGGLNKDGVLFYNTEATCGGGPLPCPNYVEGWEITCVVCTQ